MVGIWTEDNWDVKRVNSLYTMVSGRLVKKKKLDSLSWSSFVRDLYTRRVYIIGGCRSLCVNGYGSYIVITPQQHP